MDRIGKKKYKKPSDYYWGFLGGIVVFIMTISLSIWIGFLTEEEVYEIFVNQGLIGTSGQRSGILLQQTLASRFGKIGIMLIPIGGVLGSIHHLWGQIARYRRYKHKRRLFREGIIENVYDIYEDDYIPLLSWRRMKTLFGKNEKSEKKQKYPSKRELKKRIKDLEEQFRRM